MATAHFPPRVSRGLEAGSSPEWSLNKIVGSGQKCPGRLTSLSC
jgi:hypothetical protein